jgi:uncharacterized membrane protein
MDEQRIESLERRLAVLEELVREMAGPRLARPAIPAPARPATPVVMPPAPRPPIVPPNTTRRPDVSLLSSEQWIGQRLLLAVGVVALILAAGYLLRLSFDRGWISPLMRCVGGACTGVVVGAVGWRLHGRYRTYGAALIGCGAAIIYLSVWAAAALYDVLPSTTGIVGLALVSVSLAMIAYAIDVEALGTTAAMGAFFAPLLLGRDNNNPDLLLLYLASMAAGLGLVAARRQWRLTMFVVALSYFGVAYTGAADHGQPWAVLLYGVIGGSIGIHLGLRDRWWETRFLSFTGGWAFVAAASQRLHHPVAILFAGLVLAAPLWWYALLRPQVLPVQIAPRREDPGWSLGEAIYFLLTPWLLAWAIHGLNRPWFNAHPGTDALIVAVPYVLAGYQRTRPVFALVGAAALGVAAWQHWQGIEQVWALLPLVLLWPALDHRFDRYDGRWYALATLWVALDHLFTDAMALRTAAEPAFVGGWALAMWATTAVVIALAAGLWRVRGSSDAALPVRSCLWCLAGAMVLFGVTGEIGRYFSLKALSVEDASLASGLAVSAWWLVFAAALVSVGFRRSLKPLRMAGLAVAGLAVVKVLVFDLSSLDALYRVGSVFILGLVFLLLAYLYHRQAQAQPQRTVS